jgi:beta-mannanase
MWKQVIFLFVLIVVVNGCRQALDTPSNTPPLWGFALDGYPIDENRLVDLQKQTGLDPEFINFFVQWPQQGEKGLVPVPSLDAIWSFGAVPCMTWEPFYYKDDQRHFISYKDLLNHQYDDYLSACAEAIRIWNKPVIMRLMHEMNLKEYHWGTDEFSEKSPEIYIQMYRYIVDFFRKKQVRNVFWAFCPNCDSVPFEQWNLAANYYPGHNYVDILGMDGYDWGTPARTFEDIFLPLLNELRRLADKPVIVFETATVSQGEDRQIWIEQALSVAAKWNLRGIIWFQVNKEHDWELKFSQSGPIRKAVSPAQQWIQSQFP